jgi:hypothetical protein
MRSRSDQAFQTFCERAARNDARVAGADAGDIVIERAAPGHERLTIEADGHVRNEVTDVAGAIQVPPRHRMARFMNCRRKDLASPHGCRWATGFTPAAPSWFFSRLSASSPNNAAIFRLEVRDHRENTENEQALAARAVLPAACRLSKLISI